MIANLDGFVQNFCQRNSITSLPKVEDCYDFHIGNVHTKLLEYSDKLVFLSELATAIEAEESSEQLLIQQFITRNAQHINEIIDSAVYDHKSQTIYLQRVVDIDTLDELKFEEMLFEHMGHVSLYDDIF